MLLEFGGAERVGDRGYEHDRTAAEMIVGKPRRWIGRKCHQHRIGGLHHQGESERKSRAPSSVTYRKRWTLGDHTTARNQGSSRRMTLARMPGDVFFATVSMADVGRPLTRFTAMVISSAPARTATGPVTVARGVAVALAIASPSMDSAYARAPSGAARS